MYKQYNDFLADSPPTRDANSGDDEDVTEDDDQEKEREEKEEEEDKIKKSNQRCI